MLDLLTQFAQLLAAGSRGRLAASPCGCACDWTLFLQLNVQLKRIHNALLYREVNMVEIIRRLQLTGAKKYYIIMVSLEKTVHKKMNSLCCHFT